MIITIKYRKILFIFQRPAHLSIHVLKENSRIIGSYFWYHQSTCTETEVNFFFRSDFPTLLCLRPRRNHLDGPDGCRQLHGPETFSRASTTLSGATNLIYLFGAVINWSTQFSPSSVWPLPSFTEFQYELALFGIVLLSTSSWPVFLPINFL